MSVFQPVIEVGTIDSGAVVVAARK